jgi:hypothetical protein
MNAPKSLLPRYQFHIGHLEHDVVGKQRGDPRDVSALERGDETVDDSALLGRRLGLRLRVNAHFPEARPCSLQSAVDARGGRAEKV